MTPISTVIQQLDRHVSKHLNILISMPLLFGVVVVVVVVAAVVVVVVVGGGGGGGC